MMMIIVYYSFVVALSVLNLFCNLFVVALGKTSGIHDDVTTRAHTMM